MELNRINDERNDDWILPISLDDDMLTYIKNSINKTIKNLEPIDLSPVSTRGSLSKQYKLYGGKDIDHIDKKIIDKISPLIISNYKELFEIKDFELELVSSWTVLADKGGWHKIHNHIKSREHVYDNISIVMYLESPEHEFHYPGDFYIVYEDKINGYLNYMEMTVTPGTVFVMPSKLMHGAYPASGKRQTLNFELDIIEK